jgi:hypothetical protein
MGARFSPHSTLVDTRSIVFATALIAPFLLILLLYRSSLPSELLECSAENAVLITSTGTVSKTES